MRHSVQRVRILAVGNMYPPHHLGGYEVICRSCVRYLRSRAHDVRVLTTRHRVPSVRDAEEDPDVHRQLRWYWRGSGLARPPARVRLAVERHNARVLARHLHDQRPNVVCWWAMGGMTLSLIERVRQAGLPAVGVICDDWLVYGPSVDAWSRVIGERPRLRRRMDRLAGIPPELQLDDAAAWIFVNDLTRERAAVNGAARVEVAHAGVDLSLYEPEPVPSPWRWRLLYAGRIDAGEGIATAIEALTRLPAAAHLSVVGRDEGRHVQALRARARELGVAGRVTFEDPPGPADLARDYASADVLVFPVTAAEPWRLVPLEAMASGTPVVATGAGGWGEYLEHERNCLLHPPGDAGALAAAVERVAADEELRGRLREAGLETAAAFSDRAFNEHVERALLREAAR
jgi:glycogen synthase